MELKPVNSINNDSNTIRVSDGNSPIRLIFKDAKGEVINLYDKIDYFYLTKDDETFYSVTDISYEGDEVIFRLPKLRKGQYKAEIRDKDGSIYPANEDLYILLRRSFEDDKDIYYFGHREDILNSVEPMVIQHIEENPDKFRGERGQQGFPGRDGLPGIDGKDGKDGIDGEKGDPGRDGSMSFVDLTPEEKEELRGERGRPGLDGKDGIDGKDGLPGRDGIDGIDGKDGKDGKDGIIENINPNLIPLDIDKWELGGKYQSGTNWDNGISIRMIEPFKIEEGVNYTFSDKSNLDLRVSAIKAFIYKNGQMVQYVVRAFNNSTKFLSEGDECIIVVDGRTDRPLELNDITNVDFKVKLEKGLIETPLIDAIHQNQIDIYKLKSKVNILNYSHLVSDGNWTNAILKALEEAETVYFPDGKYTTYPIETSLSNRSIIGNGLGTQFEIIREGSTGQTNAFVINGSVENVIRKLTSPSLQNENVLYLDNTSGLKIGDDIRITSQKNGFSSEDTFDSWLLGKPTNTQKLPFGEYGKILEVHSDRIVLTSNLIFPHYDINNVNEVDPANTFSYVEKINFNKNFVLKDFQVVNMVTGYVLNANLSSNFIIDNVNFDDSNYSYGQTGIVYAKRSLNAEIRNCSHFLPVDNVPNNYYWTNTYKFVACQNVGVNNCLTENAGQSVDLTYIDGDIPNIACYVENCKFINNKHSSMTSHGGDYLTKVVNNQFIGCGQGMSNRGRGAIISGNVFVGTSKNNFTSTLAAAITLYQGGACDAIITNNTIRNYNIGIVQRDTSGSNGRIGYSGTIIKGNIIKECNIPIHVYRLYSGEPAKLDNMGLMIIDNQIHLNNRNDGSPIYGIHLDVAVVGVTIRGNIIKGLPLAKRNANFYGVRCEVDVSEVRLLDNTYIDLDYGASHPGYRTPNLIPDLRMNRERNEFLRVVNPSQILGGVRQYNDTEVRA